MGIIRVLLALSVLFSHSSVFPLTGNKLVGGVVAVQCFYIISGFYMALVLTQRYATRADFYFNRFLRLYPTYWFLLAASTLSCLMLGIPTFVSVILNSDILHWDGKIFMLFTNVFIFGSDAMMFMFPSSDGLRFTSDFGTHPTAVLYPFHSMPQAWTLPVEMLFYAIAPFIVKSPARLIGIFIVSMTVRYFVYLHFVNDPWTYRFFPSEAAFFCAGALAFHVYGITKEFRVSRDIGLILFVAIILYIADFNRVPVLIGNTFLFSGDLLQFYGFALVALPFIFHLTRDNRVDRWLGEMSYPIYLTHLFVINGAFPLPHFFHAPIYDDVLNTLIISAAINFVVQTPIERWLKRTEPQVAQRAITPVGLAERAQARAVEPYSGRLCRSSTPRHPAVVPEGVASTPQAGQV